MTNIVALDLNLLVSLEALLAEASVGRAARRVGLSQPAMSHALARLRESIGDPLLVRTGVRMQLTPHAETLRAPLDEALQRVRAVFEGGRFDPRSSTRRFRIMMSDYVCHLLLPRLQAKLARRAPYVHVDVVPWCPPASHLPEIAESVDMVVSCVPDAFTGFRRERLFTDEDALVLRRGHPLAPRGSKHRVSLDACLAARHVAVVGLEALEDPVDTWLREEGRPRDVAIAVPHYLMALHVVAQTDLLAIVPRRQAAAYAKALKLVVARVPLDPGTFDEYLLHPARVHDDRGGTWLRELIADVAKALPRIAPGRDSYETDSRTLSPSRRGSLRSRRVVRSTGSNRRYHRRR